MTTQTSNVATESKGVQVIHAYPGEVWDVSKSKLHRNRKRKAREAKENEEEELIQQLEEQVATSFEWKQILVKTWKDSQEKMTPVEAVKWLEHVGLPIASPMKQKQILKNF